jgi:isopenicillin N synthase-like dioxygenase
MTEPSGETLDDVPPPPEPPPILSSAQLEHLISYGYVTVSLPTHLDEAIRTLFKDAHSFFALEEDVKVKAFPARTGVRSTDSGYVHVPGEKEYVTFRFLVSEHDSNDEGAGIKTSVAQTWNDAARFLLRVLSDVGIGLDIPPYAWDHIVWDSLNMPRRREEAAPSLLRVFRYEPQGGVADPHRDVGLLTLSVSHGPGLQVWHRRRSTPRQTDGTEGGDTYSQDATEERPEWRDAGEMSIMIGDTLRILSGNRLCAAHHRVVATETGRSSIVFTLRPSIRDIVDLSQFGGEGVVDGRLLWRAIANNRVNINAPMEVRQQQRLALQQEGRLEAN